MMLKHYSYIRMEAKRKALESIVSAPQIEESVGDEQRLVAASRGAYALRSTHTCSRFEKRRAQESCAISYVLKLNGSAGRTRTYNPSVNSRMLCH